MKLFREELEKWESCVFLCSRLMESGQGWETGRDQGDRIAVTIRVQNSLHAPALLCARECLVIGASPLYACQGGTSGVVLGSV